MRRWGGGRDQGAAAAPRIDEARTVSRVDFRPDAYAAAEGADFPVIITEWNLFRALEHEHVLGLMRTPALVNLRNIDKLADMQGMVYPYALMGQA